MNARNFPKLVSLLLLISLIASQLACSVVQRVISGPASSDNQSAAQTSTAASQATTPEPAFQLYLAPLQSAAHPVPADWPVYSSPELGLHFSYPPLPGEARYEFNDWPASSGDPRGTLAEWTVDKAGGGYQFAFCASQDMAVGRDLSFIEIIGWTYDPSAQAYSVILAGPNHYQVMVEPLLAFTRQDGLEGMIFRPPSPWKDAPGADGVYALLSLALDNWPSVKVISFFFPDPVEIADVKAVVSSVTFSP